MGISTHILDTGLGKPAAGVRVSLASWQSGAWVLLKDTATDSDGRVKQLLTAERAVEHGLYRLRFETAPYYEAQRLRGLYPYIDIVFEVSAAEQHYHVPLLLTANGYTTYRGS